MTNVLIVPLLELLLALFALGLVATLVNLRDFIPKRFRFPIYAGVVVLLMTTAAFVSRSGGPGVLGGVWVASLALVVSAHQLEQWRKETEERKRDGDVNPSREVASGSSGANDLSLKMTIILSAIAVLALAIAIQYIYNPHPELNFFPGFDPRK